MSISSQRIEVIDVLRGFALLGIIVVHSSGEFAGWSSTYNSPYDATLLPTAAADSIVNFFVSLLFINKSRALFAFLFGIGFYFQLGKASRSGHRIESKFAKRMAYLFLIAIVHAYLIWSGDILRLYAICGLLLLSVYKWKPNILFVTACICAILVPAVANTIHLYIHSTSISDDAKRIMYEGYAGESYTGMFHANLLRDASVNLDPYSIFLYLIPIWGNFLFGYQAAQTGLIQKLMNNKKYLLTCLFISGISGMLFSNNFVRLIARILHTDESHIDIGWRSVFTFSNAYSVEATAFFLLCIVIYLYEYTPLRRWLSLLTFAGRMSLTNYMMQSLFAVVFFFGFGFGFISRFGAAIALSTGIGFFILQLLYSYIWFRYFTTGPVEYLWRSLIEGKWQTIRKQKLNANRTIRY